MKSDSFRDFVLEQLAGLGQVHGRAMFGGCGIYAGGVFFAILYGGRLFFRADESTNADYVAAGMKRFEPEPGVVFPNYYEVPVEVLEDAKTLVAWARRSLECQARHPSSRSKRKVSREKKGRPRVR